MVSVCLPSDALSQHLSSYLGFSYPGRGVSLHGCSSKAQLLLLTLDEGYLFTAAPPGLECGVAPLSPPAPAQPPFLEVGWEAQFIKWEGQFAYSSHVWMWELDYKESWALKNWCFWTVVLEKTLESPLDCKEIQPVQSKRDQSWVFTGRTDAEAETPVLWPPDVMIWIIGKDPDAGKDWRLEEKGTTEDEMVGWHHWLNGYEFEQALGVGDEQGGLAGYSPWGCRVRHNWATELKWSDGQFRGRVLRSTNYYVHNKLQGYIGQYGEYSQCMCASVVSDSVTPWIVVHQALLSVGFSRQEY